MTRPTRHGHRGPRQSVPVAQWVTVPSRYAGFGVVLLATLLASCDGDQDTATQTTGTSPTSTSTSVVVRPNIVLIMADDLGEETLDAYGDATWETPTIDQLADEGLRFETVYATPICTPSRVQLLSGLYPFRTGWTDLIATNGECLDPELSVLANTLQQSGYRTAMAGKWQLCRWDEHPTNLNDAGFDEAFVWSWRVGDGRPNRYWDPGIWWDDQFDEAAWVGAYGPDLDADFLISFIEQAGDEPFFAYYPMALPHSPYLAPPTHPEVDPTLDDPAHFGWMVTYMDTLVARVLDALETSGQRENTLVVFTGDNGTDRVIETVMQDGSVVQGGKGTMGEPGLQVPLVFHWPGRVAPEVRDDLVDFTDLMPTLVELAGVSPPPGDGHSIAGYIDPSHGTPEPRSWVYGQYDLYWSIRGTRWKLDSTDAVFDLDSDPTETAPYLPGEDTEESAVARAELMAAWSDLANSPAP